MNLLEEVFASLTLGFICGFYYILLAATFFLVLFSLMGSKLSMTLLILLFSSSLIPLSYKPRKWFMYSWVFRVWREYFDFKIVKDGANVQELAEDKKYLFVEYPHGIFPMGPLLSASLIEDMYPGKMIRGVAADVIFKFPILRFLWSFIGTRPASKKDFLKIWGEGHHVGVIAGGIAEMFMIDDEKERLYFQKRTGYIKIAVEQKATLIPVFFFGNTSILRPVSQNSFLATLSRKLRLSIVFFYGRFGLPIPFKKPILEVIGNGIDVNPDVDIENEEEVKEEVERLQGEIRKELERIWEEYKPDWETKELSIE